MKTGKRVTETLETIRKYRLVSKKPPEFEEAKTFGKRILEDPKTASELEDKDLMILFWLHPETGLGLEHIRKRLPLTAIKYCYSNMPNKAFLLASDILPPELIHHVTKTRPGRAYILSLLDPVIPNPGGFRGKDLLQRLMEKEIYAGLTRTFRKRLKELAANKL